MHCFVIHSYALLLSNKKVQNPMASLSFKDSNENPYNSKNPFKVPVNFYSSRARVQQDNLCKKLKAYDDAYRYKFSYQKLDFQYDHLKLNTQKELNPVNFQPISVIMQQRRLTSKQYTNSPSTNYQSGSKYSTAEKHDSNPIQKNRTSLAGSLFPSMHLNIPLAPRQSDQFDKKFDTVRSVNVSGFFAEGIEGSSQSESQEEKIFKLRDKVYSRQKIQKNR